MKKALFFISLFFFTISVKAHQPDISTTMLVEKENNTWVLQVRASLSAFQHEIKTHFADTPYKTPEEFKEMVLEHLRNNFQIILNGDEQITLKKGFVKLGHETNVVFEVTGIPSDLKNILVKNSSFNDIYKSQSTLVILKKGYSKERFFLNNENNHTLKLETSGHKFINFKSDIISKTTYQLLVILIVCILFSIVLFRKKYSRRKIVI